MKILVVGAGLFGAVVAHEAHSAGHDVTVVEKRSHIGGNAYTYVKDGIIVHKYGAHIFHTNNHTIWQYIRQFGVFENFINSPIANYKGELYNLPFNMNTFNKLWGVITPGDAKMCIQRQSCGIENPKNLEEQAISLVGTDIYEKLIKGYTEKQWGKDCKDLPASIIKRIPVRFIYNNNYFNDEYQGIPVAGYTEIINRMLSGIKVLCNVEYHPGWSKDYDLTIYTGPIDAFFNYKYGPLEYRSLRFETLTVDTENYQGVAVMNYTDRETPWTRIIEHKHFDTSAATIPTTIISKEYPVLWTPDKEPYYPIRDEKNLERYHKYQVLAYKKDGLNVIFGGRLGEYQYYDMDKTIESALNLCGVIL